MPKGKKAAPLFWTSTINGLSEISLEKPVNPHKHWTKWNDIYFVHKTWWGFRDSNPGPIGYEPSALTN